MPALYDYSGGLERRVFTQAEIGSPRAEPTSLAIAWIRSRFSVMVTVQPVEQIIGLRRTSFAASSGSLARGVALAAAILMLCTSAGAADEPQIQDVPAASGATEPSAATTAPEVAPDSASTEEAAIPLDAEKERYFYFEGYWQRGVNYIIKQHILPVDGERRRSYGFADDLLLSGRIGFRVAGDAAAYLERAGLGHIDDGVKLRRAFVYFTGDFFLLYPASFKVEAGTVTTGFLLQSAWVRWRQLPYVGTFKIGQYDPPFGLEAYGSSNDLTFMESSSQSQAFAPGTKFGLQLADTALADRLTWAFGWFADTQEADVGDASDSLARLIGRLTYVPYESGRDNSADRRLVHLGLGVAFTYSTEQSVRYQSRPESFVAPTLVDTLEIDASSAVIVGGESAWVRGPFSLQSEATVAYASGAPGDDPLFWGLYANASLFLTGETRPYSLQSATFGHVEPRHPLWILSGDGWGAWETGGRYSYVDLTAGDVRGGRMHGLTYGLNWYWNRYVRWQFNYQWELLSDGSDDGRLHVFQTRLQLVI